MKFNVQDSHRHEMKSISTPAVRGKTLKWFGKSGMNFIRTYRFQERGRFHDTRFLVTTPVQLVWDTTIHRSTSCSISARWRKLSWEHNIDLLSICVCVGGLPNQVQITDGLFLNQRVIYQYILTVGDPNHKCNLPVIEWIPMDIIGLPGNLRTKEGKLLSSDRLIDVTKSLV